MESPVSVQPVAIHDSVLSPLREPLFRSLWIAAVISYTGSWMQNVATGWLMTSLTSSPMWVALVQVAVSLPVLLIALPAGALADIFDRRKFLLFTQASMVAAASVLGVMTLTRTVTPQILLVFTFLLGVGAVMNDPAWQSLTPDLVPPNQLGCRGGAQLCGLQHRTRCRPGAGRFVNCCHLLRHYRFRLGLPTQCSFILWRDPVSLPLEACKNRSPQRDHHVHGSYQYRAALCTAGTAHSHRAGAHAAVFYFCQRVLGIASADRQQVWRGRLWRNAGVLWTGRAWRSWSSCAGPAALLA